MNMNYTAYYPRLEQHQLQLTQLYLFCLPNHQHLLFIHLLSLTKLFFPCHPFFPAPQFLHPQLATLQLHQEQWQQQSQPNPTLLQPQPLLCSPNLAPWSGCRVCLTILEWRTSSAFSRDTRSVHVALKWGHRLKMVHWRLQGYTGDIWSEWLVSGRKVHWQRNYVIKYSITMQCACKISVGGIVYNCDWFFFPEVPVQCYLFQLFTAATW